MEEQILDEHLTQSEDYPNENDYDKNLHGLSGWLAFLGFSLLLSTAVTIGMNAKNYYPLIENYVFLSLNNKIWLGVELFLIVILISIQCTLIYLYFKKKKRFIILFKIYLVYLISFGFIDNFIILQMIGSEPEIITLVKPAIYAIIWMSYIVISKQVKHTFIYK